MLNVHASLQPESQDSLISLLELRDGGRCLTLFWVFWLRWELYSWDLLLQLFLGPASGSRETCDDSDGRVKGP